MDEIVFEEGNTKIFTNIEHVKTEIKSLLASIDHEYGEEGLLVAQKELEIMKKKYQSNPLIQLFKEISEHDQSIQVQHIIENDTVEEKVNKIKNCHDQTVHASNKYKYFHWIQLLKMMKMVDFLPRAALITKMVGWTKSKHHRVVRATKRLEEIVKLVGEAGACAVGIKIPFHNLENSKAEDWEVLLDFLKKDKDVDVLCELKFK